MGNDFKYVYTLSEVTSMRSPRVRLWVHRIKKFLFGLIKFIDDVPKTVLHEAIRDSIPSILELIPNKIRWGVSLYDLSLAVFWDRLISYGIMEISILKLIRIAKNTLKHKITHGKVLRIISFLRESRNENIDFETRAYTYFRLVVDKLFELPQYHELKHRSFDILAIKDGILLIAKRILRRLSDSNMVSGSPKVLAAVILYTILRLCRNVVPTAISSSIIERLTGVNRFTILRRYKQLINVLVNDFGSPSRICCPNDI